MTTREPGFGAGALAFVAGVELADFDFFFDAEGRFLERDLHVVTQIGTTLSIFAARRAAAEKRLENSAAAAEDLAENVERIMETAAAAKSAALRESAMPKRS